ncbi:LOG family protein [Mucilaginibacter sp.]|uniref:LOG family protein n=1 Tax=Mucilaginibacter sp. TaxID=1882438 RepID=UPI0035BBFD15
MKAICVFCGANISADPLLKSTVEQLAQVMVAKHITLIYGGGKVGVMGALADAVLNKGGKVIGVIPQFLMGKKLAIPG